LQKKLPWVFRAAFFCGARWCKMVPGTVLGGVGVERVREKVPGTVLGGFE